MAPAGWQPLSQLSERRPRPGWRPPQSSVDGEQLHSRGWSQPWERVRVPSGWPRQWACHRGRLCPSELPDGTVSPRNEQVRGAVSGFFQAQEQGMELLPQRLLSSEEIIRTPPQPAFESSLFLQASAVYTQLPLSSERERGQPPQPHFPGAEQGPHVRLCPHPRVGCGQTASGGRRASLLAWLAASDEVSLRHPGPLAHSRPCLPLAQERAPERRAAV